MIYIMKIKIRKSTIILICIYLVMILLNAAAWISSSFSDWYALHILPVWVGIFSRVTSAVPFSVGDVMITLAVVIVVTGLPLYIVCMIVCKGKRKKVSYIASQIFLWIVAFIITTETLNCFIMYHCTDFSESVYSDTPENYSASQLIDAYEIVVSKVNLLCDDVQRDEDGYVILTDDLYKTAQESMKNLISEYPRLQGYYPRPKKMIYSQVASQEYLMGIFLPFSLEVNYNGLMKPVNYPSTICHEYAHLKGIMQEDEAGFIAFVACTTSENKEFQYSGYLSVLSYFEQEIDPMEMERGDRIRLLDIGGTIKSEVYRDRQFLTEEVWEDVEEKAVISTEIVNKVDNTFTDTSLKLNGVSDGIASYGRKLKLLLDYYYESNMLS